LKAVAVARACSEKKALDITIVDMRKMSGVCEYFVIASGTSTTQVRAIADNIARRLKEKDERVRHMEGEREGLWVLIDCQDVVAHVFFDKTRRFYDLESLWAAAPQARFRDGRPVFTSKRPKKPARKKGRAGAGRSKPAKRTVSRKRKK
jgi:ribosome-associated protein